MHKDYKSYLDEQFDNQTDEQLINLIKKGNEEALTYLMDKYKVLVNSKVCKFFLVGAEKDDISQEGMIGLFKAIKSFQPGKQSSFKTFANMCVERQLITTIKNSNRQKHIPLNSYLSLNTSAYDNDDREELIDTLNLSMAEDPLDMLTQKEYYEEIQNSIDKSLSKFEKQVLNGFVQGDSYVNIATKLDAPVKSVDNAIQRIRKKALKNMIN